MQLNPHAFNQHQQQKNLIKLIDEFTFRYWRSIRDIVFVFKERLIFFSHSDETIVRGLEWVTYARRGYSPTTKGIGLDILK